MNIIKRVLAMEPVAVQAVARSLFVFLGIVGLSVPENVSSAVLAAIVAAYAVVEAATTLWARSQVRPEATVDRYKTEDGLTVAGPASDLPTGMVIHHSAVALTEPAVRDSVEINSGSTPTNPWTNPW